MTNYLLITDLFLNLLAWNSCVYTLAHRVDARSRLLLVLPATLVATYAQSAIIYSSLTIGINPFGVTFLLASIIVLLGVISLGLRGVLSADIECMASQSGTGLPELLLIVPYVLTGLLFVFFSGPPHGWDVLDHWAPLSNRILQDGEFTLYYSITHPVSVSVIPVPWALIAEQLSAPQIIYLMWAACGLLLAFTVALYSDSGNHQPRATLSIFFLACASIPLIENHVFSGGYAELFLTAGFVSSLISILLFFRTRSYRFLVLGILLCCTCIFTKNIGFMFAFVVIIAFLLSFSLVTTAFFFWGLLFFIILSVLYPQSLVMLAHTLDIELPIIVGSRALDLSTVTTGEILGSISSRFFVNSSFSVCGILWIMGLFSANLSDVESRVLVISTLMLFLLVLGAHFFEYGLMIGNSESDTGASRLLLPWSVTVVMLISRQLDARFIARQRYTALEILGSFRER